jgi:2-keto-4-pentenoate hydratase
LPHAHARCDDRPVDASDISKAADDLYRAQRVRRPIPPLTTTYGAITVDDAYQIQLAWLANKVAGFGGALEPGHAIMPGSCTRMIPVRPGDVVRAEFDRLGYVSLSFCPQQNP